MLAALLEKKPLGNHPFDRAGRGGAQHKIGS